VLTDGVIIKKRFPGSKYFFIVNDPETPRNTAPDNMPEDRKKRTPELMFTIGKVTLEKLESIASKMRDDVATEADRHNNEILQEIVALATNRVSVAANESEVEGGGDAWTERTSSHFPHIRLHGGALEDDPLKMNI
jgi:hypothetical protein